MPPRQPEKSSLKQTPKLVNRGRVDSVVMPPRSGGNIPTNRIPQSNTAKKQFNNPIPKSPYDTRNGARNSYMPPVLQQPYGGSYPRQHAHTGGPIRHERPQLPRGTPYNIPPPLRFQTNVPTLPFNPSPASNYQQRPGPISNTRNVGRTINNSPPLTNGRNVQTSKEAPLSSFKISIQNDTTPETSSEIKARLEQLERTQALLLKELEANKRGLQNKDAEIESLTHTIEDQKKKLTKKEDSIRSSHHNNNSQSEDNYRIIPLISGNRNSYEEDDDFHDPPPTQSMGSISATFARVRNANNRT